MTGFKCTRMLERNRPLVHYLKIFVKFFIDGIKEVHCVEVMLWLYTANEINYSGVPRP